MVYINNTRIVDLDRPLKPADEVKVFGLVAGG